MGRELSEKLGARIRELRGRARLTQQQLADLTGKSPEAISNLERGKAIPSVATLQVFANRLGVSLKDMFEFDRRARGDSASGLHAKLDLLTKGDRELVHDFVDMLLERRSRR